MKAICITKCYWRNKLWKPGEPVKVSEAEAKDLPRHFELMEPSARAVPVKNAPDKEPEPEAEKPSPGKTGKR